MLAGVEAFANIITGFWLAAIPSLIFMGTGTWTLVQPENITARVVNFWTWAIMYGIGLIATVFVCIFGAAFLGGSGLLVWFWIFVALAVFLAYIALGVAWFYIEEGKDNNDGAYSKA